MISDHARRRALPLLAFAGIACLLAAGASWRSGGASRKASPVPHASEAGLTAGPARHPSQEDTYTITSVLRVLPPVDPAVMGDDFQDVRVLARDGASATLEVTYYPLYQQAVGTDPDWRRDDAGMTAYLQPTPAENWDAAMRRDLLAQLRQDGINPDALTDKSLVEQVSRWAMHRAHTTNAFAIWDVYYPHGKPAVYPALRAAFNGQKPDPAWTDQQMFDQEALGRSMFYGKVHGSCTSSSIYLSTIFRALGIPTRTVLCIPPFDPNDPAQAAKFYAAVHHNGVRETVRAAMAGANLDATGKQEDQFANHLFNEVYVGHHWVRLNYERLGQPILDANYLGLMTHIATSADLSRTPLAQTWGMRFAGLAPGLPKLSSVNPYMLLSVRDHFGKDARLANPAVPIAELRTATITGLIPEGSPLLPKFAASDLAGDDFLLAFQEWAPGSYVQMRVFRERVGHRFLLTTPGRPDVRVRLGDAQISTGTGSFQAFGARIVPEDRARLAPGVAYTLTPQNISDTYRWAVAPGVTLTLPVR